jgi:hypothetical protein
MADWKSAKGLRPWKFTKQRNKWGYLNNPRWLAVPRKFVRGGPDDYDGRESSEPQVYTPTGGKKFRSDSQPSHHQCGHWHTPEGLPGVPQFEITSSPCYINNPQWVQRAGLSVGKGLGLQPGWTVGMYYDKDHTDLVPGTLISLTDSINPGAGNPGLPKFWLIHLPDGPFAAFVIFHWFDGTGEHWTAFGPSETAPVTPGVDKYFLVWQFEDVISDTVSVLTISDMWFSDVVPAHFGHSVLGVGLYTKSGTVYTEIPNTLTSESEWSYFLDPNDLPAGNPGNPEDGDIYVGAQYIGVPGIFFYPYVRIDFPTTELARWIGYIDSSGFRVFLATEGIWTSIDGVCSLPSIIFEADPESIGIGESSTLSWTVTHGWDISIDQGIGRVDPTGTRVVFPSQTTTYTLTVVGVMGIATAQVTVSLPAPIIVFFTATPNTVAPSEEVLLEWDTTNATSVSINQGIGPVPLDGSISVFPTESIAYTLTAIGPGGQTEAQVSITVTGSFPLAWAYWKMEEGSGSNRDDSSGNNRYLEEILDPVPNATGILGNAALFQIGDHDLSRSITTPDLTGDTHFTITFWFNIHRLSSGDAEMYLAFGQSSGGGKIEGTLGVGSGSDPGFLWLATNTRFVTTPTNLALDTWHFAALYYDGNALVLEIDDSEIDRDPNSGSGSSGITLAGNLISMSGLFPGSVIEVSIDEVGWWEGSNALSASQRSQLYNSGSGFSPY